jgi:hypothetical protein
MRVAVAAILSFLLDSAARADSLNVADTLHPARLDTNIWADSALAVRDSLAGGTGLTDRWLLPLGVIFVSALAVYLLFTVRSK